jgi:hypothetical protein
MYACDLHWWDVYAGELKRDFAGELWTQDEKAAKRFGLHRMPGVSMPGLGRSMIHFGNNSGYQAINLAYLFGATKIILLGFDMKVEAGKIHFFGNHPYHKPGQGPNNDVMARWCGNFVKLAQDLVNEGVEVINATRSTALKTFPIKTLEELSC